MVKKTITRKVISKVSKPSLKEEIQETDQVEEQPKAVSEGDGVGSDSMGAGKKKKVCFFCQNKTKPSYTDVVVLRRFVTDRAKISSRLKNNLCSKHQRIATKQIKYARHLALLPFTPVVN